MTRDTRPAAERPTFILELRPEPDKPGEAPAIVRLRRALKSLGRSYGLRCIRVEPGKPGADPLAPGSGTDGEAG